MTQAFNLGQLANKVNTSGQLDASTGLVNSTAVANGGTGRATLTAGTVLLGNGTSQVDMFAGTTTNDALIWSGTAWTSAPVSSVGGGGGYQLTARTSPSSYTQPASLKSIKVTVIGSGGAGGVNATGGLPQTTKIGGAGGGGGSAIYYAPAPALPASAITVTAGTGTNSFGALVSCTAGGNGTNAVGNGSPGTPGAGGTATGGTLNVNGQTGFPISVGYGGQTLLGFGNSPAGYGAGSNSGVTSAGKTGVVIIEEFF